MEADYISDGRGRCSDFEPDVDREPDHEAEAGLEEQLARSYADFLRGSVHFLTEKELCGNLRGACSSFRGFRLETTDEQLLEAARDCYHWKRALRVRQLRARRLRGEV